MVKRRKRINVTLDLETYGKMTDMCKLYSIESCSALIVAFSHLLLDCMSDSNSRRYNMAEGDTAYIKDMFMRFSNHESQPDGSVPVRKHRKNID